MSDHPITEQSDQSQLSDAEKKQSQQLPEEEILTLYDVVQNTEEATQKDSKDSSEPVEKADLTATTSSDLPQNTADLAENTADPAENSLAQESAKPIADDFSENAVALHDKFMPAFCLFPRHKETIQKSATDTTPESSADGGNTPPPPTENTHTLNAEDNNSEQTQKSEEKEDGQGSMSLLDHLGELRRRLVRAFLSVLLGFFACYGFSKELYHYLALPLLKVMPADAKFIYTGLPEGFFVDLKISFVAALFVASPYIFYQIWAFIAPGLYDEEKRYIMPLSFCSAIFFLTGAAFCYFVVFPFAFVFFLSYSTDNIVAMLSISEYLSFTLKMLIAFGLIFEMPLFTFFLSRMGLITAKAMARCRKYAVLAVFIVAAILTPPDVFSQVLMALPMLVLYELSILVARMVGKKKKTEVDSKEKNNSETSVAENATKTNETETEKKNDPQS